MQARWVVSVLLALLLAAGAAQADTKYWQTSSPHDWSDIWLVQILPGQYFIATPWGAGLAEPTAADTAYIGDSTYLTPVVNITHAGEVCDTLYFNQYSNTNGTVNMSAGSLTASRVYVGGNGLSTATWTQTGGTLSCSTGLYVRTAQYVLDGSSAIVSTPTTEVAFGNGLFDHRAGLHDTASLVVGRSGTAFYTLSGGTLSTDTTILGQSSGYGRFTQTGGLHTVAGNLDFYAGSYDLRGGTLNVGGNITGDGNTSFSNLYFSGGVLNVAGGSMNVDYLYVGDVSIPMSADVALPCNTANYLCIIGNGQSGALVNSGFNHTISNTLRIGSIAYGNGQWVDGNGSYVLKDGGSISGSASLYVAYTSGASAGELRGYGAVALTGTINNGGKIIADGFGSERTLDLSAMQSAIGCLEGTTGDGWYARNGGLLRLPSLPIYAGSGRSFNWGESASDTTLDMVNSVRMTFGAVSSAGTLAIDLLDPSRSDVPEGLISPIGVWYFDETCAFDTADLTFRYDDALAASLGLVESDLMLLHYADGAWTPITTGVNAANHWIYGTTDSFSFFAVAQGYHDTGEPVPEPITALFFATGIAGVLGFSLRRRTRTRP